MHISTLLEGITEVKQDLCVTGLNLNAQQIQPGDVFIAMRGVNTHGANYIETAINNGCVAVLVDSLDCECAVSTIRIDNLAQYLPTLAAKFYPQAKKVKVIGVTGTNGKTSVGFFIAQLLTSLKVKNGFIGTLGITNSANSSVNTTPDIITLYKTLEQYYNEGINIATIEVSSHALVQNRVAGLNVKQAVFTNLSQDHLDYHDTLEQYKQAKSKLFALESLDTVIINGDDANYQYFLDVATDKKHIIYGIDDFVKIKSSEHGFLVQYESFVFELNLLGRFNLYNILAALNAVVQLGFNTAQIIPLLPKLTPPIGRMQRIQDLLIWVDYAHTPDAIKNAILTIKEHYPEYKIRILFGCGGNRDTDKRAKMGKIASQLANSIVLTNDNPRHEDPQDIIDDILNGIVDGFAVDVITDRRLAIETSVTTLKEDECLLIAGKGHETTQHCGDEVLALNDIEIAQNALC